LAATASGSAERQLASTEKQGVAPLDSLAVTEAELPLAGQGRDGMRWAYRYRVGGRGSRRIQRGGFESEHAAAEALERVLERLRREQGLVESPTLAEFVDLYLAQHEGEPETTAKLRWLLQKAVRAFAEKRLSELRSRQSLHGG
jgi:hypothetical protein